MNDVTLLFDFDHTLGMDNHLEESVLFDLSKEYCDTEAFKELADDVLHEFRKGTSPLQKALGDGFRKWECKPGSEEDLKAEFQAKCLAKAKQMVEPMPGLKETLDALQKLKTPMAILSNGWGKLQRMKAKLVGFAGPVVTSEEIDAWKPDINAFNLALQKLDFQKENTFYVGDSPETDIVGAKNAGLKAIWANLENQIYPEDLIKPDFTITSLSQLPGIISQTQIGFHQ